MRDPKDILTDAELAYFGIKRYLRRDGITPFYRKIKSLRNELGRTRSIHMVVVHLRKLAEEKFHAKES